MRLILNSGGMDSAVTLAEAVKNGACKVASLYIDLGNRSRCRERLCAAHQAFISVSAEHSEASIACPWLAKHSLFDPNTFLVSEKSTYAGSDSVMRSFVVPMRNIMLLSVAISLAASGGYDELWLGFDYRGPDKAAGSPSWDKRPEFVDAFSRAVAECNEWRAIKIITPLQGNSKADTIRRGAELGVNFNKTWSCYNGLPKHCGACSACLSRKEGFAEAGINDPTAYASEAMLRKYVEL